MPKNVLKGLSVILGVLFLYGCAATDNVEVRRYIEVKDRIDQDMEEGNAGYISGTPQADDRSEIRKTRKIYVVEVSKSPKEAEEVIVESDDAAMNATEPSDEDVEYESEDTLDTLELNEDTQDTMTESENLTTDMPAASSSAMVEYTIQKDDTLQKISKKFYNSFSKWSKIYEANKDVIGDPDRIKAGTVIKIPQ
jgi:nucleoid-associated protein YgaU